MDEAAVDEVGGSEPGAVAFVWGSWTVLAVGLFAFVFLFGRNVPVWDDYDIIEVVLGRQPLSWEWLWAPHHEHRVPLPRLLLLGLDRLTDHDVRAGMYTSAFVLSAAAAALVFAMRRMRGGLLATDAFLPIVSLSAGQYTNLIWGWQVQFTVATALTLGLLALIAMQKGARLGRGRAITAGILLALLPLCGASGLVIVPFGLAWLLLAAVSGSGKESGRTGADQAVILLSSLPGLVLTAMAILTYQPASQHPPAEDLGVVGKTFVQFISLGMGPASGSFWRLTGASLLALGCWAWRFCYTRSSCVLENGCGMRGCCSSWAQRHRWPSRSRWDVLAQVPRRASNLDTSPWQCRLCARCTWPRAPRWPGCLAA